MERGSNKHGARVDDEMAHEVRGIVQGVTGGRVEESREAEPSGEDQPEVSGVLEEDETRDLTRFGRYIGLSALPGDREKLRQSAETLLAPDDVLADLDSLPEGQEFGTVVEIWRALGR
ncbi:DUF2795 domain-containing protein [Paractinoplanes maris]|uniref:DUF2795 domain-containing protein n=1 Tax=Paractinoplanes maris TaxID=1734446 RepID=UPI0020220502|nr:DUF2795 domain-containing protein [Actinoplanes maris]